MAGRLTGRTAVVTGASRGIGRAAALALAAEGAHVIAVARTVGGLEELDDEIKTAGGEATLVPLDLSDYAGIDRLGEAIFQRWGKLDMLLGNAGLYLPLTPVGHTDPKAFEELLAVNVTANFRLIRSLDPLLRQAEAGRALFVSSGAAQAKLPFRAAYATSKAALNALVTTYAAELTPSQAKANLLRPGPVRTSMRAIGYPGEDPMSIPAPEELAPDIVRMLSPDYANNGFMYDFVEKREYSLIES